MGLWDDIKEGVKDTVGKVGDFYSDIGGKAYDWITGEDVKDAANAQARVYENMARESYRQGELTREAGIAAIQDTIQQGRSVLSGVMNQAAAMGAVGFKKMDPPDMGASGVDVGKDFSQDVADLEKQKEGAKPKTITAIDQKIAKIREGFEDVSDVQLAEQAQFASGSMLTNIGTLRDELQRSRNTYIRNLQTDIYSFMLQGENYLQQAKATREGGQAAQFNTILTRGLQGAQTASAAS